MNPASLPRRMATRKKKMKQVLVVVVLCLVKGEKYEEAVRYEGTDRGLVYEYFAALNGEPLALMAMGSRHAHGRRVPKSCQSALQYYEAAADLVPSHLPPPPVSLLKQNMITSADLNGNVLAGKSSKRKEILRYYKYMSEQGETDAQLALGHLYYHGGRGLKQNFEKAFDLFKNSALKNDLNAAAYYGHMLAVGIGVTSPNETLAEVFLQKGTSAPLKENQAIALNALALLKLKRNDTSSALNLLKVASELGHPDAMYNLGLYQLGWNFTVSEKENIKMIFSLKLKTKVTKSSIQLLSVASQNGHLQSSKFLGKVYLHGALSLQRSCPLALKHFKTVAERGPWLFELKKAHDKFKHNDISSALHIYKKFAEAGYELAQLNAAFLEHKVINNLNESLRLYQLAADQSSPEALLAIGHIHFRHLFNYDLAAKFFISSYQLGRNAQAAFYLGYLYQRGLGIHKDWHLAKRHYQLAAQLNVEATWPSRLALLFLYLDTYPAFFTTLKAACSSELLHICLLFILLVGLLLTRLFRVLPLATTTTTTEHQHQHQHQQEEEEEEVPPPAAAA